jgi:hypothetical protein
MKPRIFHRALIASIPLLFLLAGCSTLETRIAEHPDSYNRLSAADKALIAQGRIREGMSQDAVYMAWDAPSERAPGRNRGHVVETWIYYATSAGEYPGPFYYGSRYGYGLGYGYYGGRRGRFHHGLYYSPFYDPFFYNHANIVRYPERIVSFENGRVIAFQLLPAPRFL